MRKKSFLMSIILISITALLFGLYNPLQAQSEEVSIRMDPRSSVVPLNGTQTIKLTLQTNNLSSKISAFDLLFTTKGGIFIEDIGEPIVGNNLSSFTQLIKKQSQISYFSIASENQLPTEITIPVKIRRILPQGEARLWVDTHDSEVVGSIATNKYKFGDMEEARILAQTFDFFAIVKQIFNFFHL